MKRLASTVNVVAFAPQLDHVLTVRERGTQVPGGQP